MSDSLAELRHDLCTPINQILGYSELLEEEVVETHPQVVADLRRIQTAATTMLALVRGRLTAELLNPSVQLAAAHLPEEAESEWLPPGPVGAAPPFGPVGSWRSTTTRPTSICWPSASAAWAIW